MQKQFRFEKETKSHKIKRFQARFAHAIGQSIPISYFLEPEVNNYLMGLQY